MNEVSQPLVSVVTPVYNGESFLAECIESVLKQTYKNYEYIIVDNCSTDRSLEIASNYAKKDSRVRIHSNSKFVEVIENHNIAFGLISPAAKYCKVVCADDFVFPDCIMQMVEVAEANPSAAIIGSFQITEDRVKGQGFKYLSSVMPGREICRQYFLGGFRTTGFGSPTSLLYRADILRSDGGFYPNSSPHADTSACLKHLMHSDFGFVYQVLSYCRIHVETQSFKSADINRYSSAELNDIIRYGPYYLSPEELERVLKQKLSDYYQFLGASLFRFRGREFWNYHRSRLEELGHPISIPKLFKGVIIKFLREVMNPEQAVRKICKRYSSKS
jgi:glycosyltransferase involved in cell wall biosynthesis